MLTWTSVLPDSDEHEVFMASKKQNREPKMSIDYRVICEMS